MADSIRNNAGPITDAGLSLGTSLGKGILEGLSNSIKEINKEAFENPTVGNILTASITDLSVGMLGMGLVGGVIKKASPLVKLFKKSPLARSAAAEVTGATALETGGTAAATATRQLVNVPKSPYSPGWTPRYQTPPKPTVPLPKRWMPCIPTAGNALRTLLAPEIMLPSLAGMYLSDMYQKQHDAVSQQYMQQFANDPYMLNQATKPEYERMAVSGATAKPLDQVVTMPTPTVEISDEQFAGLASYLKNVTTDTTNQIQVTVPTGAVQINVESPEIDYDEVTKIVGQGIVSEVKKSMENRD